MEWIFKPKVQLGLWVNFAFVMFTLVSSSVGGRANGGVVVDVRRGLDAVESRASHAGTADNAFRYVSLPPRLGPSQAVADHYADTWQIVVHTTHDLTLVKKDGRTLTLSPSFYVNGDTIVPPRNVTLRFRSDSPASKRFYADVCELEIMAEGADFQAVLEVSHGQLWKDGKAFVEFMAQDIPYNVFVKLVASKRVTFKVGDEEIALTEEQLSALRDMQRCIQDGMCG